MADESQRPIVIKRIKKSAHGPHGGAWKIAYADFVTAMMAFFLLMWLLGSTAKGDLGGIADFFNTPLKLALQGGRSVGDATSIIQGGGKDITRVDGQVKKGEVPEKKITLMTPAKQQIINKAIETVQKMKDEQNQTVIEQEKFAAIMKTVENKFSRSPTLQPFKDQILLDITEEGLRIQIIDSSGRPIFAVGQTDVESYMKPVLQAVGEILGQIDNSVQISGHTDSSGFKDNLLYDNWDLSTDRAQSARRFLVLGGLHARNIARIAGLADTIPFDSANPGSVMDRRISILVMTKQASRMLLHEA